MSNEKMFLYWGSGSAPCWKAMIVLEEKGLWKGIPNKLLEFSKKEHKGDDVMKWNPRGQLPTFRDGDLVVNESSAICMYLEEKYSNDDNRLMPTDPETRALVYQKMFESLNVRDNTMMKTARYKMMTKKEDWDAEVLKDGYAKANDELKLWEKSVTGKTYLVGEQFTMADVFFYPFLALIVRMGACLENKYPALNKYYQTVSERPSIKATPPPHWKDSPSPGILSDLCD